MMSNHHWARNFTVDDNDIEYLTGLLLEQETPLDSETLARALLEEHIRQEAAAFRDRYKDARLYNPSLSYEIGQKLVFPEFDYETATIVGIRVGNNPDYGEFNVIAVQFDDDDLNTPQKHREFATDLKTPHELSLNSNGGDDLASVTDLEPDDILEIAHDEIVGKVETRLRESEDLIYMSRKWFPRDLLMEVNVGHLNLAEAVLDISGGGPMKTEDILQEIGGLGKAPLELQTFSLNYALNNDDRFDEVGPTGEVLWFLTRLEPQEVLNTPPMLRYTSIDYDPGLLTSDMIALEMEIGDEHSHFDVPKDIHEATVTLTYPHRRLGTLPLNAFVAEVLPTARQTPRVSFTMVDGQDGEEYPACWVVRKERYVVGLGKFYRKHKLPVGAYVTVRKSDQAGKVIVDFKAYKPRTEWLRLIIPRNDLITFENQKRSIGADYDELMILGADDLAAVDAFYQSAQQQKKSLSATLKSIIPSLGALTPQGTVHAKTLYSALNVLRRCPPGPMLATLVANPDFQNVGGHYWKLSGE